MPAGHVAGTTTDHHGHAVTIAAARLSAILAVCAIAFFTLTTGSESTSGDLASRWRDVACLTCSRTWLADLIRNIALFVPLGAALVWRGLPMGRVVALGAALSLLIEGLQLFGLPAGRTPALADLVSNTLGTGIGALAVRNAAALAAPSPRMARTLGIAWSALAAAVLGVSAVLLSPAAPPQAMPRVTASPLPFTPGYGWFAATASDVSVMGVPVPHTGSGPVLVAAHRTDSMVAAVSVVGRDRRSGVVPILYVHDPSMTSQSPDSTRAHVLLAQHGSAAALSADLRAATWGLHLPFLSAPGAFDPSRMRVSLQASITSRAWLLGWSDTAAPTESHVATLLLSPALGWTLVQSMVPASGAAAVWCTLLWLSLWFVPIGYWTAGSSSGVDGRGGIVAVTRSMPAALAVLLVAFAAARWSGVTPLTVAQTTWCLTAAIAGAVARTAVRTRAGTA